MTLVRIFFAVLCQMQSQHKYTNAIRMFNYLKRMKQRSSDKVSQNRYICLVICFMHILESMYINIANILILA